MTEPIKLLPVAVRDAAMKEFLETNHYWDPETGELYEPTELPVVYDPDGDADSDVGVDDDLGEASIDDTASA
ncbi:MAG: hypothetical protein QOJ82_1176 [Solirubrobacteraceae bacterium]|jgi:hypothetical protein|nr:hypothetical protein [Solirubrobacteraceae bacterium]